MRKCFVHNKISAFSEKDKGKKVQFSSDMVLDVWIVTETMKFR